MFAKILLYAIIAFVAFVTFIGIKRMFQVFFFFFCCCSSKKGLATNLGKNKKSHGCGCGKDDCPNK